MPISPGIVLTALTLVVSLFILIVSAWNLYLSHYKEQRSEVDLLPEDRVANPEFSGGNKAIDEDAYWNANHYLKIANTGEKSAYVRGFTQNLVGLRKNGEIHDPQGALIDESGMNSGLPGMELEPHSTMRHRAMIRIKPETDIGVLVEHESAIVQHVLEVEDNKGSYEVTHETEMGLTGPGGIVEKWEGHQESKE